MPKSLLKKNYKELLKFTPFDDDDVVIYDGTPAQRNKMLDTLDAKVWLMGFTRATAEWELLLHLFPDIACDAIDEIHLGYGGHSSARTQEFYKRIARMKKFIPMTGTLINGKLDKTYPTIHAIEPRYYGSYENFMAQHTIKDLNGAVIGWRNHDKLRQILARHSIRRTFKDTYGENEIINQPEFADMAPLQREAYDEFSEKAVLELSDQRILEAPNGGVMSLRCRQIMAHPECVKLPVEYNEEGKPIAWKEYNLVGKEMTGKDELLAIHIQDAIQNNEALEIFGTFKPEIERIDKLCKKLGMKGGYMHGGISRAKRDKLNEAMEAREIDYVVASAQVAGVGYNWPHVNHAIFPSVGYSPADIRQPRDRAQRGKRDIPLRVTFQAYNKSPVERRVFQIVEGKSDDEHKVDPSYDKLYITRPDPKLEAMKPPKS